MNRYTVVNIGNGFGIHDAKQPCNSCIVWSANEAGIVAKCETMNNDKLIKMFTINGPVYVMQSDLNGKHEILTAYDKHGEQYSDGTTKKARDYYFGVHRENIQTTKKAAIEAREAIYRELCN